jgi:hypothetical protein
MFIKRVKMPAVICVPGFLLPAEMEEYGIAHDIIHVELPAALDFIIMVVPYIIIILNFIYFLYFLAI